MEKACLEKNIYTIKDVPKNLIISSVDLDDGTVYLFSSMIKKETRQNYSNKVKYIQDVPIAKAVRASCSFPRSFLTLQLSKSQISRWRNSRKCTMERIKRKWSR